MKKRYKLKKSISKLISKIFIIIIIILGILIIKKHNPKLINDIKNEIFNKSLNFIKINKLSKKIIGKEVLYLKNDENKMVNSEEFQNSTIEEYFDGERVKVATNAPIGTIESGIVIYKGPKENFNETIVVQGIDGYNIWYGNIENSDVKPYEYLNKNSLIGSSKSEYIYLLIEKDGKYIKYEDYKKNKN